MVSGVEQRVSSLDSSRCESLEAGVCRPVSISISGLAGLVGDATELYSCSRWKCGVSGDEGCGVEGLVPHSKGVVRPSTDLYDLLPLLFAMLLAVQLQRERSCSCNGR